MRKKILLTTDGLFIRYGVKSVTMDDIAKQLSISKKTIYHYFKDKNELVKEFTLKQCEQRRDDFKRIPGESRNSVEALIMTSKCIKENILQLNPSLLLDIKKYYKDAWEIFIDFKQRVFYKSIKDSIARGMKEGYFRTDINPEIIAAMRMQQIQDCFDLEVYPGGKFNYKEVQIQLLDHFMHGLLTSKGKILLEEYSNDKKSSDINL